jgi:hypothetical protein
VIDRVPAYAEFDEVTTPVMVTESSKEPKLTNE